MALAPLDERVPQVQAVACGHVDLVGKLEREPDLEHSRRHCGDLPGPIRDEPVVCTVPSASGSDHRTVTQLNAEPYQSIFSSLALMNWCLPAPRPSNARMSLSRID